MAPAKIQQQVQGVQGIVRSHISVQTRLFRVDLMSEKKPVIKKEKCNPRTPSYSGPRRSGQNANFVIGWPFQDATREASCFVTGVHGHAKRIGVEEDIARCTLQDGNIGAGKPLGRRP